MKLPNTCTDGELNAFNASQVEFIRNEAASVKECFTSQVHQTLIISSAILCACVGALKFQPFSNYLLFVASIFSIILCMTTIRVGAHKFNTANRTVAYQIHLSRTVDYAEANPNESSKLLAKELRRINWEEAMFAWRMVQPIIFHFFYKDKFRGMYFKRFKNKKKYKLDRKYREKVKNKKYYPWYDTDEIIKIYNQDKKPDFQAKYYPGTYLGSMLNMLYFVMLIGLILLWISYIKIISYPLDNSSIIQLKSIISIIQLIAIFLIAVFFTYLALHSYVKSHLKCKILESGLLSIQTSSFVWRIVCMSHLIAKLKTIEENKFTVTDGQIFNGYTNNLASIANDFVENICNPHEWLIRQEIKFYNMIKI